MRTWIFLNRVFEHNKVRLTVAGKCRQPKTEGVQVVEGVGLVPFSFQFFTRLAAVFAEEVCGRFATPSIGNI